MRKILPLAFCLVHCFLQAQPVVNSGFIPVPGETYRAKTYNYGVADYLWANGANVFWDFSFINPAYGTESAETYSDAGASPFLDSFPGATHYKPVYSGNDTTYKYYFASPDSFVYLGYYTTSPSYYLTFHRIDPIVDIKYPVTYLDSFEDYGNYILTGINKVKNPGPSDSSLGFGTSYAKIICDGYGRLRIGTLVIDSVLRIYVTRTNINTLYYDWGKTLAKKDTTKTTTLYWISNKYSAPVLTVSGIVPFGANGNMNFTFNEAILSGIENPVMENISIYPVPAMDEIYVNTGNYLQKPVTILTDITGREISKCSLNGNAENRIFITHLPPGIYFLQFYDGEEYIGTKKIIK